MTAPTAGHRGNSNDDDDNNNNNNNNDDDDDDDDNDDDNNDDDDDDDDDDNDNNNNDDDDDDDDDNDNNNNDDDDDDDNNNNNNNNRIQRRSSRFLTISLRHQLSPTRTLKSPGRNRVQITCNTSSANHVQHVVLRATWYEGTARLLRQSLNRIYLSFILLAEPLNRWRRGENRSTRRKP